MREFEQELRLDRTSANAAYEAGEIHRKSARFDRAAELFSQAVKYYPDFVEALVAHGRTLVSLGKAEQALAPVGKAVALDAANDVAWFQRLRESRRQAEINILTRQEVTKQSLDAKPPQE